ncbi:MAG TPA: hypothetical protein VD905_10190 [Flavobacteriales bacterium]|nr:hypothetical protein [Flavobacteriales bacterium]
MDPAMKPFTDYARKKKLPVKIETQGKESVDFIYDKDLTDLAIKSMLVTAKKTRNKELVETLNLVLKNGTPLQKMALLKSKETVVAKDNYMTGKKVKPIVPKYRLVCTTIEGWECERIPFEGDPSRARIPGLGMRCRKVTRQVCTIQQVKRPRK